MSRLATLAAIDLRLQMRFGVLQAILGLAVAWALVILVLPRDVARSAAPFLLFVDTATVGTFFIGAFVVLERVEGAAQALDVSPTRFGEYAAAKIGLLVLASTTATLPIALAAGLPIAGYPAALIAVALTASFLLLLALAVAVQQTSLIAFLLRVPLVAVPFIALPLAHAVGLVEHAALNLVPTVGTMDLLLSAFGGPATNPVVTVAYPIAAAAVAAAFAWWRHRMRTDVPAGQPASATVRRTHTPRPARHPVLAFARNDLQALLRDPLIPLLAVSPLLLALALRFGYPLAEAWLRSIHGIDVEPARPLLFAAAVVLHVPLIFGMVGSLLVLEEADDRTLLAIRVSPITLERYLAYRSVVVAAATAVGLALAMPISNLGGGTNPLPAAVAAIGLAPLMMLTVTAIAANKVEAITIVKLLGLPLYLPLAAWFVGVPATWLLAPLPSYWVVEALWSSELIAALAAAAISLALLAVLLPVAWRRSIRRLGG